MSEPAEDVSANDEALRRCGQASWVFFWLSVGAMLIWVFRLCADPGPSWERGWTLAVLHRAALWAAAMTALAAVLALRLNWWRVSALVVLGLLALSGLPMWAVQVRENPHELWSWIGPFECCKYMISRGGLPLALLVAAGWFARAHLRDASRPKYLLAVLALTSVYAFFIGPIALPYYDAKHRPVAHNVCLCNVKALALSLRAYAADQDGHFPPAADWPLRVAPYATTYLGQSCPSEFMKYFCLCPQDNRPTKPRSGDLDLSYTFSVRCGSLRLGSISEPDQLAIVFDGTETTGLHLSADFSRHNGGINVAFADGHCKWKSEQDFAGTLLVPGGKP